MFRYLVTSVSFRMHPKSISIFSNWRFGKNTSPWSLIVSWMTTKLQCRPFLYSNSDNSEERSPFSVKSTSNYVSHWKRNRVSILHQILFSFNCLFCIECVRLTSCPYHVRMFLITYGKELIDASNVAVIAIVWVELDDQGSGLANIHPHNLRTIQTPTTTPSQ